MIDSKEGVGKRIRDLRKDAKVVNPKNPKKLKKMSIDNLGDIIRKDKHTISEWETGEKYPPLEMIVPLANALGSSPEHLLGIDKFRTRTLSELGEQIPLNEKSIKLLTDLKSEYDKCSDSDPIEHDCLMKAVVLDGLIEYIITPPDKSILKFPQSEELMNLLKDCLRCTEIIYEEEGLKEKSKEVEDAIRQRRVIVHDIGEKIGKAVASYLREYHIEHRYNK